MRWRGREPALFACVVAVALLGLEPEARAQDPGPFLDASDLPAGMVLVGDARSQGPDVFDAAFAEHGGTAAGRTVHLGRLATGGEVRLTDARAKFPTAAAARAYVVARSAAIGGEALGSRDPLGDAAAGKASPSASAPQRVTWIAASADTVVEVTATARPDEPPVDASAIEALARRAIARIVASRAPAPVAQPRVRVRDAADAKGEWPPRKTPRPPRESVDHAPRLEVVLRGLVPDGDEIPGSFGGTAGVNAWGITHAPVGLAVDYDLAAGIDSQGSFLFEGRGMLGPGLRLGPVALAPMLGVGLDAIGGGSDDAFDMEVAASWSIEGRARVSLGRVGVEGNVSRSARGTPSSAADDVPRIIRGVGRVFFLLERGDELSAGLAVTDYGPATAWGGLFAWSP